MSDTLSVRTIDDPGENDDVTGNRVGPGPKQEPTAQEEAATDAEPENTEPDPSIIDKSAVSGPRDAVPSPPVRDAWRLPPAAAVDSAMLTCVSAP